MQAETLRIRPVMNRGKRPDNDSLRASDLPALIEKMKRSQTYANGEPEAMVLLRKPEKKILLTVLNEDTEIVSSQSNGLITFQIIEGKLKLYTGKKSITLDKGQLLTLNSGKKYKLTCAEETVFLLTIVCNSGNSRKL